jgi:hypothetical protein
MDKNHYFPMFHGIKSAPVKVVCNCDGQPILEAAGFIVDPKNLPESREEKQRPTVTLNESKRTNS